MTHTTPLGDPIGAPVPDWTSPPFPPREVLEGSYVRLEPLSATTHAKDLFEAFAADETGRNWTYRLEDPFPDLASLTDWLERLEGDGRRVWHAYVDRESGKALGNGSIMNIAPGAGVAEIGSIMFSPAMQGTVLGTAAMYLTLDHLFGLGYRRVEWTCDASNAPSRRAAERLGFTYEACFRQANVYKGRNRDKAVFSIIDREWPERKAAIEGWLDPSNFDAERRQRAPLATRLGADAWPAGETPPPATPTEPDLNGDPVGLPVPGWTAPPRPPTAPMEGQYCRLEQLSVTHTEGLHEANTTDGDGRMWTYLNIGPFDSADAFRPWVADAAASEDPRHYAVIVDGKPLGTASYLRIDPAAGSIEVGHITFSPLLQRTRAATEAMFLMMQWAFEAGYRRYEWKCNAANIPSRRAAQRFGFSYEGVFRQALLSKGRNRDTAWYACIDSEWPALKSAFEAWLDPANFDEAGLQRRRLSELTAPILVSRG